MLNIKEDSRTKERRERTCMLCSIHQINSLYIDINTTGNSMKKELNNKSNRLGN